MFCSNRFILPGSPSTCVIDTAIVPVPSCLLIIGLAILLFATRDHTSAYATPGRRATVPKWLHIVYMILVLAAVAMTILEIIRLVLAHLGVGLLPIPPVALLLVFSALWYQRKERTPAMSSLFLVYWLLYGGVEALKVVRLNRLNELHPAKDSKYPSSDKFLDNVVMLGLYVVFAGFEIACLVVGRKRAYAGKGYEFPILHDV